jgi:hypothetical protein
MVMKKKELAPGIIVYSNILNETNTILDNIKKLTSLNFAIWKKENLDESKKAKTLPAELWFNDYNNFLIRGLPYLNQETNNNFLIPEKNNLYKQTFKIFDLVEKDYLEEHHLSLSNHDSYSFLQYSSGDGFSAHIDSSDSFPRTVSIVCYLNDDYIGGEINFLKFNISYKAAANEVLIFPANYVYSHSVSPVISGVRYSIASWLY